MKTASSLVVLAAAACVLGAGAPESGKSLADIYKSGRVRFIQEAALDEKTMPEGVQFIGPADVAVGADGGVFVLDFSDNNLKIFDAHGTFLKVVGRKGQGPGEFNMPSELAVAGDRLAVWDMGNRRLALLTRAGEFIESKDAAAFTARPRALGALPSGDFLLETEKTYFNEPDRPQDCSIDVLSPDLKTKNTVHRQAVLRNKYKRQGSATFNVIQPFAADVFWRVTPAGGIVVGFSEKYEFVVFTAGGAEEFRFSHPYKPVKVTAEDEKGFFAGMSYTEGGTVRQGAPEHIVKHTVFPRFKPAFNGLFVDSEGNFLVHTHAENKQDEFRYFDAFNAEGRFLARVRVEGDVLLPVRSRISPIVDGCFWMIKYDVEDSPEVIKYRISE